MGKSPRRATPWFFSVDLALVKPDGAGLSPALRAEVSALKGIPMDDAVAETPHSLVNKHAKHSRHASWEWVASTTRLEQHLRD